MSRRAILSCFLMMGNMHEPAFLIEPMNEAQIDPCFVLARLVQPWLDLPRWRRHARGMLAADPNRRGTITIRWVRRDNPCGLACYRCMSDIEHGLVMAVRPFAVMDPLHGRELRAAMATRLAAMARAAGCGAMRIISTGPDMPADALASMARAVSSTGEHTFLF